MQLESIAGPKVSPPVTLVLGGVRSGKSRYGLEMARESSSVTFIATAVAGDDAEMQYKIARHKAERPAEWTTIEEPLELPHAIARGSASAMIVIDCLTIYAANLMHACGDDDGALHAACESLFDALAAPPCPMVVISNEVGSGVVPPYELGRRFRDLLGEMNQRVASIADRVVLMVAGLPLTLKPEAPR